MNVKRLKANVSKIAKEKYHLSERGIEGYWDNKVKEESYQNKKNAITYLGAGGMVGTAIFSCYDAIAAGFDCLVPILIAGGVSILTTSISLAKKNPYTKAKYEEIDEVYEEEKAKLKRRK